MGSAERGAHSVGQSTHPTGLRMEAIKKKMQSMKVEKDNLMDRCDNCEQAARDAKIRLEKTEEEATELSNKAKTLEVEVDVFGEKLSQSEMKQKAKEAQVMAAEAEFNRLNRRVQELEEDLENTETKFVLGSQKLDKAATTADDSDRMKKVLENRAADDEKKLVRLAEELKEAQKQAEDADKMYDETQKKMMETERNLEVSDERASVGEFKIIELEEDRLEDELLGEQEKFKAITEELDQTFAEMSG